MEKSLCDLGLMPLTCTDKIYNKTLRLIKKSISNKSLQVAYVHAHAEESFMVYSSESKQDKKMFDMEKSYFFHSVIIPVNHVVTINEGCT